MVGRADHAQRAGLAGDAHRETRAGLSVDVRHFVAAHRRIDDEIAALEVQHPLRIIARIKAAQSRILPDKMEQCAERPDRAVTLATTITSSSPSSISALYAKRILPAVRPLNTKNISDVPS